MSSALKKAIRARMRETGENYTTARRALLGDREPAPRAEVDLPRTGSLAEHKRAVDAKRKGGA